MTTQLDRAVQLNETRKNELAQLDSWMSDIGSEPMSAEQRTELARREASISALAEERDDLMVAARTRQETDEIRNLQEVAFGNEVNPDQTRGLANAEIRSFLSGQTDNHIQDVEGKTLNAVPADVMAVHRERQLLRMGAGPEEMRAHAWAGSSADSSGSVVPTELSRVLYTILEQSVSALRMPTTKVSSSMGNPMEFPKVATLGAAATVVNQLDTIAGTDASFDKVSTTPVKVGQLVTVANEVISDTAVDIVQFVGGDIARAVGRQANTVVAAKMVATAYVGSGGIATTGGTAIGATADNLIDLEHSIVDEYRSSPSAAYWMRDATAANIRKIRDGAGGTEGNSIWQTSVQGGISGLMQPDRLYGRPVYTDPNVPAMGSGAKIMAFGDWSNFIFRSVGSVMVERNDSVAFASDAATFRGLWRVDGVARDLAAVNWLQMKV